VHCSEGMNKYTSYRVDVRVPPAGSGTRMEESGMLAHLRQQTAPSAVLRRYSDFLWLYERMHRERAGAVVPPLPEKQAVARFSAAFVEDRRVHLEQFLRRVAVHPELHDCPALDLFLRAEDAAFLMAKQSNSNSTGNTPYTFSPDPNSYAIQAPPKKDGIKKWFSEAKTSIAGDLVRSPDDDLFEEIERYVHNLDMQMRGVSQQASSLVRKGKEIANGLFEFGLAFNLLGQSESDGLGQALGKMGEAADRLSVLSAEHAEGEMARFEEPLRDYIKTVHAVKVALSRRHEKRVSYTARLAEVDAKKANLFRLRGQPGMEAKAYAAEMSLQRHQESVNVARDEFAAVSQRVLREVDRFKTEKAHEMRTTVLDYITLQVEYNRRMEEIWTNLIPQLSLDLDGNAKHTTYNPNVTVVDNLVSTSSNNTSAAGTAPTTFPSTMPPQPPLQPPPQPPMMGGSSSGGGWANSSGSTQPYGGSAPVAEPGVIQYRDPLPGL
jgi:sorting nexin-1/2